MYRNKEQEGGACIHVGGVSFSQFGLVHAIHEFLQLDRQRHVSFDLQLPWHECHRGLQFPWNNKTAASLMFPIVIFFFFFFLLPWWQVTWKHLAEVTGVHFHDNISFGGGLTLPHAARASLQVQKPNASVLSYMNINKCWRHAHWISLYGHKC